MTSRVDLILTARPLERIESEIAVAGFFTDERPLRGGAARADWRLCGGLSRRIENGDLSGKSGEAMLISCGRALRAPRLMLLGLGERRAFDAQSVAEETCQALVRCRELRMNRVGLSPLGIASDDLPRHAGALMQGILSGCEGAEHPLTLEVSVPRAEVAGVYRALEGARDAAAAEDQVSVGADDSSLEAR